MATVIYGMRVSADGFVADGDGNSAPLYPDLDAIADHPLVAESIERTAAVVLGRTTYDMFGGDATGYEYQTPIFVVTHDPPAEEPKGQNDRLTIEFVTEGVEAAVSRASEAAGDGDVPVIGASIGQEALAKGLVDEVSVWLVPLLLGGGKRMFGELEKPPRLEQAGVREFDADVEVRYRIVS
jgi:dihydrofolate reductase